jgi:hypothetical protein
VRNEETAEKADPGIITASAETIRGKSGVCVTYSTRINKFLSIFCHAILLSFNPTSSELREAFLSPNFVADLYMALSEDRLEAYRPNGGSDLEMLTNYFWNIDLIEALVPCMHAVELALRNSIHNALTAKYGTPMWFYQPGVLESQAVINLGRALQEAAQKTPLRPGKIVAALSFGFWVSLLGGKYEQRLWQPNGFALQKTVFPYATGHSQKDIRQRFDAILQLRNRCFHHEGIWHRSTLQQEHAAIHEAISWISPMLQTAILSVDSFDAVLNGRDDVEAELKKRFKIT